MVEKTLFDFQAQPKSAWLTVNRGCNFRCKWCYGQATGFDPSDTMSLELAKELTIIAKETGIQTVNLIGGEPTIWPFLSDYISFCKSNQVETGLITNACRFGDDSFWNEYRNNPCDHIGISVKCGNRKGFVEATGVDSFDKTMLGIKRGMSFYDASFSTVYNEMVGKEGLLEIATACKELGARSMTVSLCSIILKDNSISSAYAVENSLLVHDLLSMYPILDSLFDGSVLFELFTPLCIFPEEFIEQLFNKGQISSVCHVHDRSGIVFDTNGSVLPCNTMIGNHIAHYGIDFKNGSQLLEFLNSDEIIDDYRILLRYPSIECSACRYNQRCKGGCILNWLELDPRVCKAII